MDTNMSVKWINQLLIIFIEKRPGEITRAIAQEENCIGDDFLRVACACQSSERVYIYVYVCRHMCESRTCCIGNLHAKNHDKGCIIWSGQVIANQPTDFLLDWDET